MMSSTSSTSMSGVTLMSDWTPPLLPPDDIPMALLLRLLGDRQVDVAHVHRLVEVLDDREDRAVRQALVGLQVHASDPFRVLRRGPRGLDLLLHLLERLRAHRAELGLLDVELDVVAQRRVLARHADHRLRLVLL